MAITDGTAGSGLARGSRARLGHQPVEVGDVARLEDGTIAGSVATMNQAMACLVERAKIDLIHAVEMCSAVPARELRLDGHGTLAPGAVADFVALDAAFGVRGTWIGGRQVYSADR
jgi:N-acetylglucosamine-6-phosphate deacetylase